MIARAILRTILIILCAIPLTLFAGEKKMIKQFDEHGLKQLNNLLHKQDKLIRKLMKGDKGTGTKTSLVSQIMQGDVIENTVELVGIPRGDGRIEVWHQGETGNVDVSPTKDAYVYETQARMAVPSSYFLDLRGIYKTNSTQQYTADVAVLYNAEGDTITLTNIDETNNIGTAGPIAGGRDKSGAFTSSDWIHFFFIYNQSTKKISSLSSESPTSPTLPTGYTFFVRVGSVWLNASGQIVASYQMDDKVTYNMRGVKWDSHVDNTSYVDEINISNFVPVTAKLVHGFMGLSSGTTARKMFVAANADSTIRVGALCDAMGTGDVGYGVSGSKDFTLPLLTPQRIWWITETTGNIYAILLTGYTDDL